MKHINSLVICLAIFLFTSCDNGSNNGLSLSDSDYIIFGHFYGECGGETCIEIFRLEKDKLFEDINDNYPNSQNFYDGNYVQLSHQKFIETQDLMDNFPPGLLAETNHVIGQPDETDGGGIYLEYNVNGIRKFWLLDEMKSNVPAEYHDFIDKVNGKIEQLQ